MFGLSNIVSCFQPSFFFLPKQTIVESALESCVAPYLRLICVCVFLCVGVWYKQKVLTTSIAVQHVWYVRLF